MKSSSVIVVTVLVGIVSAAVCLRWTARLLEDWRLTRRVGGRRVPSGAGMGLVMAAGLTLVVAQLLNIEPVIGRFAWLHLLAILLIAGFAISAEFLGGRDAMGLSLRARRPMRGREKLGQWIKSLGIVGAIVFVVHLLHVGEGLGALVLNSALVALSAHLLARINERPGRTLKSYWVLFILLLLGADSQTAMRASPLFIAALCLGPFDLSAKLLVGEVGSLVLGASLGLVALVALPSPSVRVAITVVLLLLTLYAEWRSVSAVIERSPSLRLLDGLGTPGHATKTEPE